MKRIIAVVLAVTFLLGIMAGCGDDGWKERESKAFENQLQKDPRDWTQEEADRYDDFSNWLSKQ